MRDTKKCLDMLGQEIVPGSVIAHAQRNGNSGDMTIYIVEDILTLRKPVHYGSEKMIWEHTIIATGGSNWFHGFDLRSRPARITTPERAIILDGDAALLARNMIEGAVREKNNTGG